MKPRRASQLVHARFSDLMIFEKYTSTVLILYLCQGIAAAGASAASSTEKEYYVSVSGSDRSSSSKTPGRRLPMPVKL